MFIFCYVYLLFGKNGDLVRSENLACNLNFLRKNNIIRQNIQLDLKHWKLFYKVKHFKLVYANMGFPGTSTGKNSTCIEPRSPAFRQILYGLSLQGSPRWDNVFVKGKSERPANKCSHSFSFLKWHFANNFLTLHDDLLAIPRGRFPGSALRPPLSVP